MNDTINNISINEFFELQNNLTILKSLNFLYDQKKITFYPYVKTKNILIIRRPNNKKEEDEYVSIMHDIPRWEPIYNDTTQIDNNEDRDFKDVHIYRINYI